MSTTRAGRLSRDFWRLWSSAAASNIGDGIRLTALPLLVAAITRDPVVVSGVTVATFTPWLLFSLPGGVIVDRVNRRKLILTMQLVRGAAVTFLGAAIVLGLESVGLIYATAFIIGVGEVFVDSATQAAIPMLVEDVELENANSKLLAVEFITNDALGGPLGAWLFAAIAALPFFVDGATFMVAAALIARIGAPMQDGSDLPRLTMLASIKEGIVFVRRDTLLTGLAIAVAGANLAIGASTSILVLLALEVLGLPEFGFGILIGVGAVGGFIGAVGARKASLILGRRHALTLGVALLAIGQLILGTAINGVVAGTGLFISGLGISLFSVVGRSLRQAVTPDRILGRVVTTFRLIGIGAVPVGALLGGIIASAAGIRVPYWIGAAILAAVAGGIYAVATDDRITISLEAKRRDPAHSDPA
ncbi:MAG: MFS transporter [Acidimicrobiia bacterium]